MTPISKPMEQKIAIANVPYSYSDGWLIPDLNYVSIIFKLRQMDIKIIDLGLEKGKNNIFNIDTFPAITPKFNFVFDIYEFPLLISLAEKFIQNEPINSVIEPDENIIKTWALERDILPQNLIRIIRNTHTFLMNNIYKFSNYNLIYFNLSNSNFYNSVFTSIIIKKLNPLVKIIFGGEKLTQSKNSSDFLLLSGIADEVILNSIIYNSFHLSPLTKWDSFRDKPDIIPLHTSPNDSTHLQHQLVESLIFFKKEFNFNKFYLGDYLIKITKKQIQEFCSEIKKSGESFLLYGNLSPEEDEDTIGLLKSAGLVNSILNINIFNPIVSKIIFNLNKHNINAKINLYIGSPLETEDLFIETLNNLKNFLLEAEKQKIKNFTITSFKYNKFDTFLNITPINWNEYYNNKDISEIFYGIMSNTPAIIRFPEISNGEILHRLLLIGQLIKRFYFNDEYINIV
jgi:hypothetical protein